ncbi:carboxymuconolactone decarboxylase family protein [Thalassolituus alkanivorans]|uniref:carboxymuconolactone decarboxylase family protein n=1 Tax=Thalassolituus alkanivorans TaxID=2881055 RepID=UPI001E289069|nr:carboxymuconolactone decarboxylase family protein [Thalassolituus alkanivorans]MCB2385188.1 carboxymuconolactone decarboxylase family protein [Thalassolituus alkanivorans]MCB2421955.1 carboxymuconolactone decarboxylase family protein [Thalassolituus alkanivorans]
MSLIDIPTLENSAADSRPVLEAVNRQLGSVPNLFRLIGVSPAALQAYSGFNAALSGTLDVKTRERIALAVAQVNRCDYCLSAHAYLGLNLAKLSQEEISRNRLGTSDDSKAAAAVSFAALVAGERGHVNPSHLEAVRAAGFSDAQIIEIVALVAENTFTNYLNEVARTDIDFPVVRAADAF